MAAARRHGAQTMFTLSGGHVFPLYDGAVKADPPMRIVDVRHEQTAVFAAEATARLTRTPGFAVLTAGPGVTNGVSAPRPPRRARRAAGRRPDTAPGTGPTRLRSRRSPSCWRRRACRRSSSARTYGWTARTRPPGSPPRSSGSP